MIDPLNKQTLDAICDALERWCKSQDLTRAETMLVLAAYAAREIVDKSIKGSEENHKNLFHLSVDTMIHAYRICK
jgi:hypothetical protein